MVCIVFCIIIACLGFGVGKIDYNVPPQAMDDFQLPGLLGQWYEVFSSRIASNTSSLHSERYCVVYEFGLGQSLGGRATSRNSPSRSSLIAYEMHR